MSGASARAVTGLSTHGADAGARRAHRAGQRRQVGRGWQGELAVGGRLAREISPGLTTGKADQLELCAVLTEREDPGGHLRRGPSFNPFPGSSLAQEHPAQSFDLDGPPFGHGVRHLRNE